MNDEQRHCREELSRTQKIVKYIKDSSGLRVLHILPSNLSSISYQFEDIEDTEKISFEEFLSKYSIDEKAFDGLKTENVGENSLLEIYKTHNFLIARLSKAENKLRENGFELDDLMEALMKRLVEQVTEAGNGQRKLKNGTVAGLSKYSSEGYTFMKVPYYAFACANVSLDIVKVKNNDCKECSLREIDDLLGSKNDEGGLFLPNSIGVSACLMTKNEKGEIVFIAQERNNASTLTQRSKFVASASGAVGISTFESFKDLSALNQAAGEEVREELGVSPVHSSLTEDEIKGAVTQNVSQILGGNEDYRRILILGETLINEGREILGRELGLDANLLPGALVFEDKRRNPEFVFIGQVGLTLKEVIEHWEKAEDKNESLSIKGFTLDEIYEEIERRKNGGEKQIDDHFFMSFLGYLIKISH